VSQRVLAIVQCLGYSPLKGFFGTSQDHWRGFNFCFSVKCLGSMGYYTGGNTSYAIGEDETEGNDVPLAVVIVTRKV
jgi:hypothetical protein